jgi:hypothetical protein
VVRLVASSQGKILEEEDCQGVGAHKVRIADVNLALTQARYVRPGSEIDVGSSSRVPQGTVAEVGNGKGTVKVSSLTGVEVGTEECQSDHGVDAKRSVTAWRASVQGDGTVSTVLRRNKAYRDGVRRPQRSLPSGLIVE